MISLPLASREALAEALATLWGIRLPRDAVCPGHTAPLDIAWRAYTAADPVIIVRASRGCGKTMLAAALGVAQAACLGAQVTILGGSAEQSERVHDHMRRMWTHPDAPPGLVVGEPTRRSTVLAHGGSIRALAASSRSVRGPHPERLVLDEVDEIDTDLIDAALGQPHSRGAIRAGVLAVSTEHYPDGGMAYMRRMASDRGWPVLEYCYRECLASQGGWLSDEALERMRASVPQHVWRIEYELGDPVATDAAIDPELIARITMPGSYHDTGELVVVEAPDAAGRYVVGVDWARKEHTTVAVALRYDTAPYRVVAFRRLRRVGWGRQAEIVSALAERYRAIVYHDTTGLGDVVHGLLDAVARPIVMTPRMRAELVSRYIGMLERGCIMLAPVDSLVREHRMCTWDDLWGAGHMPDGITAMALAVWGATAGVDPGITI